MEEKNYTIALLIDTDNVSAKYLTALMKELIVLGKVTYKRMYGDFTSGPKAGWRDLVNRFSIMPVQQYSYTAGKNVTDSKMIIDAMDILYTGNVDAFCLMSSDSDFTGLAKRLKESNMFVIGAGESKTPASFINACDRFFKLDKLTTLKKQNQSKAFAEEQTDKKQKASNKKRRVTNLQAENGNVPNIALSENKSKGREKEISTAVTATDEEVFLIPREEIEDFVVSLFENSDKTELPLSYVMQKIFQAYPDFNPKDYGVSKARKFFDGAKFGQKKGKGTEILICLKEDL